jgi:tetratricopeptide (TPR) repeat protein
VLVLALALALPATARGADQPEAARAAFGEAERLYQLGRFEEAIGAYERAYALDPQPAFLHNIALAHRRQFQIDGKPEHLRRARELYRNYLRVEPSSSRRAAIEKIIDELAARLEKEPAPPPPLAPRLETPPPPPAMLVAAPPAEPPRRSHTVWWIAGGLVVAGAVVATLVLTRNGGTATDGPAIDLGGVPR